MSDLMSLPIEHQAKVLLTIGKAQNYVERHDLQITDEEGMLSEIVEDVLQSRRGAPMFTKIVQRHTV